jgi:predicted nucleotidyltransferase
MIGTVRSLLTELKRGMEALYGERLNAVYLYGSHARGDQERASDVDVLVVLGHIDSYGAEIDLTSELVSSLSLQYDLSISRVFVSEEAWLGSQSAFFSNVREEAVAA